MNLLNLELEDPAVIELRPSQRMTMWLGTWATPADSSPTMAELVFEPHEVPEGHPFFMDHHRNTFALWADAWYHARIFNVATNVERYLADKSQRNATEREALARLLPFHLCVQAGRIKATVSRRCSAWSMTPKGQARHMSRSHRNHLQDSAVLMPSLHSKVEWQLLEQLTAGSHTALTA